MFEVDSLGQSCPIPVVQAKKALKTHPEGIVSLVDNAVAKENVSRLAEAMGYKTSVEEADGVWRVRIEK